MTFDFSLYICRTNVYPENTNLIRPDTHIPKNISSLNFAKLDYVGTFEF